MPAKSKQQQKFMGIVRAIQKGEAPAGKFSKSAQKAAKSMKKSSVRKYAKTKHDDLPKKIKENKDDEEKWSGIGYDSFESIKEKKNPKDVYDYLVYVRKYKPDLWNNLKKKKDIQKIMKKFESVNEGKANIYGIEYRKFGQPGTKFLKSSLKMVSHQGWEMHKKMTMAILKNAEKLRKQDKWSDYRVTINGAPYIGWAGGRMTKYPPPKLNESDLGLTYKKGKTVKVKHKTSGRKIVIIDKPNVRKEYEKIGYFAEGSGGYGIDGKVGSQPAGPHLIKKKKKKVDEGQKRDANNLAVEFGKSYQRFTVAVNGLAKSMTNITGDKTDGKIIMKAFKKHIIPFVQLVDNWNSGQQKNPHIDESVNERRQYKSGSQEMNFIVQQLVKYGNTKSDAIKMTQKHYNNVLKRYKEPWFIHPVKKAEIISSLSANESVNEVKKLSDKELVDYMLYIREYKPGLWNHLKKNPDMKKMINKFKLERKKKKKGDDKWKGLGYDSFESVNEAPGKNHKDQYVGQARVKVKPGTYKGQKVNYHDVSMYRDHKKPYHYYLSIRLAHSDGKKVDMVISTGTHILKKAGKWAQGFINRRMSGTGRERFT